MKKKLLRAVFLSGLVLVCAIGLMACDFGGGNTDDPKPEHQHAYVDTVISPTCTEQGYTLHKCTCGNEYRDNYVNATGHTYSKEWLFDETAHWHIATCEHDDQVSSFSAHQWNGGVVTTEPTEDAEGIKTYTCIICKATKTDKIPKVVHVCSYVEKNTSLEYLASEADCTNPAEYYYSCSCGKKGGETFSSGTPSGHNYGVATYEWNGQNCTATRICQHDNSHKETETVIGVYVKDTNATCTVCEKGHYKATFTKSAFVEQNTAKDSEDKGIPLGHSFINYVSNNNATCSSDGTKTAQCDRCNAMNTITDTGSKLDHTYSNAWTTNDDYHWHQAICEHSTEISGKSLHDWVDTGVIITKATETVEGEKEQKCSVCNKTRIIKTGYADHVHTFDTENWLYDETYHWHSATCGHDEVVDKVAHNWNDGEIIVEYNEKGNVIRDDHATVYSEGVITYKCSCGAVKEEVINKIDSFSVVFFDKYNNIVSERLYSLETAKKDIYVPNAEQYKGLHFIGWFENGSSTKYDSYTFTSIKKGDVFYFTAKYERQFEITFNDYEGNQLGDVKVVYERDNNISLTDCPEIPKREGYTADWNENEIKNITESKIIVPKYTQIICNVIFRYQDGTVIDDQKVPYGSLAIEPKCEQYYFDKSFKLFEFAGWDGDRTSIQSDTIFTAQYEQYDNPVVAVKIKGNDISLSIILPSEDYLLYSINLSISWTTKEGTAEIIAEPNIKPTTPLNHDECRKDNCTVDEKKSSWITYNNKTKTFNFIWNCGNGHSFNYTQDVINLTFDTDNGAVIDSSIFELNDNSAIIYGKGTDDITKLSKELPMIWFYE